MTSEALLNLKWKRPESVTFPTIWRRFERKDLNDPSIVRKFRVQDVTDDTVAPLMHLMETDFIKDEPLCKSIKFAEDSVSVQEFRQMYWDILKQKIALVCLEEGPDGEILKKEGVPVVAGYNMIYVSSKSDSKDQSKLKGKALIAIVEVMGSYATDGIDMFQKYGVDILITALGLSVASNYRGMGLGAEILKAREAIGRAVGVNLITTVFSSTAAKVSAAKVGYKTLVEKSIADASLERPDLYFPEISIKTITYTFKVIDP